MDEQHDPGQVLHGDWVQQQGFTQTENVVLRDTGLSVQARFLYSLLKMYAWQKGSAYPGQETLAELMGVKIRMVQIYLKELIDKGLIERKQRGLTKSNLYIIKPLNAIYCAPDTQSITGQKAQRIAGQDAQSTTHEEDTTKKTQQKKREITPPRPVTANISRKQPSPATATRDMPPSKPIPVLAVPLPDNYPLTDEMHAWARAETPSLNGNLATEHAKFCAYYRSISHDKKLGRRADWRPVWELWMRRVADGEFAVGRATQPAPKTPNYFAKRG